MGLIKNTLKFINLIKMLFVQKKMRYKIVYHSIELCFNMLFLIRKLKK